MGKLKSNLSYPCQQKSLTEPRDYEAAGTMEHGLFKCFECYPTGEPCHLSFTAHIKGRHRKRQNSATTRTLNTDLDRHSEAGWGQAQRGRLGTGTARPAGDWRLAGVSWGLGCRALRADMYVFGSQSALDRRGAASSAASSAAELDG